MQLKSIFTLLLFHVLTVSFGQDHFALGMEAFNKRADNATGMRAPEANVTEAMRHFENAFNGANSEKAYEYYLRAAYFKSTYCDNGKSEKLQTLSQSKSIGKKGLAKHPQSAALHYWYAVSIGARAKEVSVVTAAKEGIIDKLKEHCETVIELDPSYEYGGGYRFLGILNLDAPYIPFVLSWPDDDEAVELLRKALKYKPNHISGQYYLAKALNETGEKEEAIKILKSVVKQQPDPLNYLETKSELDLCESFLRDLTE